MQDILKRIESGSLPRVLLVHGPEPVWHDLVYNALKKRNLDDDLAEWNWSVFHGSKEFDLEALLVELGMVPWGESTKIVVLKEAHLVPAGTMQDLADWLEKHPEANSLALFLDKKDKRLKYLKTLAPFALEVECEVLQGERLIRYVQDYCIEQGRKMDRRTAQQFLERVGSNLLMIHNELEKLIAWSSGREEITGQDVQTVSSLSPGQVENNTVFQMTDFIMQKKRQEALDVLNLLLASGEQALRILPLIERQFRLVLAAKTTASSLDKTAQQMGERSSYALTKVQRQAKQYELDEIFTGFSEVVKADRELKLGVPGDHVLTDLIIKLTK